MANPITQERIMHEKAYLLERELLTNREAHDFFNRTMHDSDLRLAQITCFIRKREEFFQEQCKCLHSCSLCLVFLVIGEP